MRLLSSEIRASGTGHRLRIEFIWDAGLLLRAYPATEHGYGFKGRQPARFVAMWRPGDALPTLHGLSYANGGFPRPGMLQAFRADLLVQFSVALEEHPEMMSMPCALLRGLSASTLLEQSVVPTSVGEMLVEQHGPVVHVETQGLLRPLPGQRYLLAEHADGATTMLCWTMDLEGVRRRVDPTRAEKSAVQSAIASILDRPRPDDYPGLRRMLPPPGILDAYGVDSLHDLVLRLNEARHRAGRRPLPSGSYPTSMVRLRSFLRLVAQEMPFSG